MIQGTRKTTKPDSQTDTSRSFDASGSVQRGVLQMWETQLLVLQKCRPFVQADHLVGEWPLEDKSHT